MKIVIIGASGHVEYALQSSYKNNIVAYAPGSVDEDLSRIKNLNGIRFCPNYTEMLSSEKPDVAVINPHFYLNGSVLLNCIKAGVHAFVEKPISLNTQELNEIKLALSKSNVKIGTMMVHRYDPWFAFAFEQYNSGIIGKALHIYAQKSYKMGEKPAWMLVKEKFGGIIPWVGAHAVDWLMAIGSEKSKVLFAQQSTVGNNKNGQVESNAQLVLRLGEINATLNLDYLRPEKAKTHGDDRLRIAGEKGIIEVMNNKVKVIGDSEFEKASFESQPNIFDDFIRSIEFDTKFRISEKAIFDVAEICIEAEEKANETL